MEIRISEVYLKFYETEIQNKRSHKTESNGGYSYCIVFIMRMQM